MPPTYRNWRLSPREKQVIKAIPYKRGKFNWDSPALEQIKRRLKDFHLRLQGSACCYCRKNLVGEFRMVMDIEHVLPQSIFPELVFDGVNLSVACKRCNMLIKKERWDFVHGSSKKGVLTRRNSPDTYEIVHPNLDVYERHLMRFTFEAPGVRLVKFSVKPGSKKGKRTKEFFALHDLEVDAISTAQGIPARRISEVATQARELFSQFK